MNEDFGKLLKITQIEPPENLSRNILAQIELKQRQSAKTRFILLGSLSFISLASIIPASLYAFSEFGRSGFYQYLSLLFSDGGLALSSWKEFSLSVAESVPLLAMIAVLSTSFVFLESVILALKNAESVFVKKAKII